MNTKQLKDKILAMAMRGELVEQDPSDESAEILLEKIKEEKAKLIALKKIKKEKPLAEIEEDEIPYTLPQGWVWTRLGEIVDSRIGKTPDRKNLDYWGRGYSWVSIADMNNKEYISETKEEITELAYNDVFKNKISKKGTLIMSFKLTIGKTAILERDAFHNEAITSLVPYLEDSIDKNYLKAILPHFSNLTEQTNAIMGKTLNKEKIRNIKIPLPPLAEQKRIVEKIETLFAEVDKLEESRENLDGLKGKLDKKLLDMAMRGELVEQDPTDESAEILLEKIKEEKAKLIAEKKIKKEKTLAPIEEDEIPYALPQGWVWTRLGEIFEITSSKRVLKEEWTTEGVPFYRAREIVSINKGEELKDPIFISKETYEEKLKVSGEISVGDLLVTGVGTLGVPYLVREKFDFYFKDGNVVWFKNIHNIFSEYVLSFMYSPLFIDTVHKTSKGSTVGTFTIVNAKNILIPLPPLAEQKRIVERLESVRKIVNESL